jgi:ribonuclease P protein component
VANKSLPDAAKKDVTALRGSNPRQRTFPRAIRLLHKSEFDAVYREGGRRSNQPFLVFYRRNGLEHNRFGMSVKKALGGAVTRNRIRRRVREILRQHLQEIAPGWDIVIHPRSTVASAKFSALETELLRLLRESTGAAKPPASA